MTPAEASLKGVDRPPAIKERATIYDPSRPALRDTGDDDIVPAAPWPDRGAEPHQRIPARVRPRATETDNAVRLSARRTCPTPCLNDRQHCRHINAPALARFSGDLGDNSNIFLGVRSDSADITNVVYLTFTADPFRLQSVNINQMSIDAPVTAHSVPGPMLGAGLPGLIFAGLGLIWWLRTRRGQAAA